MQRLKRKTGKLEMLEVKKRDEQIAEQRKFIPERYRKTYDKAVAGKGLRAAVNARCLDCCAWQRTEIRDCPALSCPLWAVRPYQKTRQIATESQESPVTDLYRKEKAPAA